MLSPDKSLDGEITLGALMARLADQRGDALVFEFDGRRTKPGYHVTEIKTGAFSGLDCGANPETWTETFIQLWDIDEEPRDPMSMPMSAGKFVAIIDKVHARFPPDPGTKLTFEVSDGIEAMRLYRAENIAREGERTVVRLAQRAASCKPRDRWLAVERDGEAEAQKEQKPPSCCAPQPRQSACCA